MGEALTGEQPPGEAPAAGPAAGEIQTTPRQGFTRSSAVMAVGTTLSRVTGFLRLSAMAAALGVGTVYWRTDAYNVANNTPNIIYELVLGGILTSVFVPVFVEWTAKHGRDEAWQVARSVLTIATVVLGAIMVVAIVAAPWIVRLYTLNAHGPDAVRERELATFFLRWFMPQIVFYGLGAVVTGLLNAHRRFAVPMFAPILNNLIVIATMILFAVLRHAPHHGVTTAQRYVLAIGTTLGVVAMTVGLWPSLRRIGFRFRWRLDWTSPAVRRIARLAAWVFLYVAVNQVGLLVVIVLAAGHTEYTAYISAFTFFQLPHAIFAVSIMTALLPSLSAQWAANDTAAFRGLLARGLRSTAFIVIPAALGYIVLAQPIVRLLLQHGATGAGGADLVAEVLVFFSLGLFSFSVFQLLLRAFYAMQDTKTPALINVGAVALNTAANLAYFHFLGVRGLALGHATAYTFAAVISIVLLRRRLGKLEGRMILRGLAQVGVAAGATAGAAFLVSRLMQDVVSTATIAGQVLQVACSVGAGLAVFLAVALALRIEDLALLKGLLPRSMRRRASS
ncbi:MAG: murein biosynthesis integral membrane protein MurJ [Actinomycetota bacterium]